MQCCGDKKDAWKHSSAFSSGLAKLGKVCRADDMKGHVMYVKDKYGKPWEEGAEGREL